MASGASGAAAGTVANILDCTWLDPIAAAKFSSTAADCPARTTVVESALDAAIDPISPPPVGPQPIMLPASVGVRFAPPPLVLRSKARRIPPSLDLPADLVSAVAARHRIDPLLLDAIIARESAGRPHAVSIKGARGLMQVMPATGRALGVRDARDLADPAVNLVAGATYLKQMQARFGNDLALTLAAYNAGPGAVARHRGIPPYAETRAYVANIMGRYAAARHTSSTAARQDAGR